MAIAESPLSVPAFANDDTVLHPALIEALYSAVLLLEDEARHAFDLEALEQAAVRAVVGSGHGAVMAPSVSPAERIALACAGLRLNIRLMQISEWLLARRQRRGEAIMTATHPLPSAPGEDSAALALLPDEAQRHVRSSVRLHDRVATLDRALRGASAATSVPVVRSYWQRIASASF